MTISRRDAVTSLIGLGALGASVSTASSESRCPAGAAHRSGIEGQRQADLGDGKFLNPVLSGDRSDPNVLKDGDDYYATFSSFTYYPGVVVWHSRDLVNWRPIGPALRKPIGSVCALDIAKHNGRYYIYIPIVLGAFPPDGQITAAKTYVVHADSMAGPWSEPIDMDIDGHIDPGHIVGEDGRRYLFLSDGARVRITDDGLKRAGPIEKVYEGWPIPPDWEVEGIALEGPKLLRRNGWFYMFSAEGGTAGPATSHMVIVARSRSIHGPWENHPANPIVHTRSAAEPWWSRGHATPIEGPDGRSWMSYHGYENGYRTLGRQMLLEPIEWRADGWPYALGGDLSCPLPMPARSAGARGTALSANFRPELLGTTLQFADPGDGYLSRARFAEGALSLTGQGTLPGDSSPLTFIAGDRGYDITVDVELTGSAESGLLLFYKKTLFCGVSMNPDRVRAYLLGKPTYVPPSDIKGSSCSFRLSYRDQTATFSVAQPGKPWHKVGSYEVSGYHHNIAGQFLSLRPAIFVAGQGAGTFRNLRYAGAA